jgi:flagellar biosynthesis/type III secretory pathway protein FliH
MLPYTRPLGAFSATPLPWALQELHAHDNDIFRSPTGDVLPTEAEIAAEALAERERLSAEAFDAGYRAGRADAEAQHEERLSGAIGALQAAVTLMAENEARYLGVLEDNLAALAVCVARQLIAREVRTSPDITIDLIRRAVSEFPVDESLRIRLNPFDLSALAVAREGSMVKVASGHEIAWVPDARVNSGGCVIEGRERILDGRVDTALERAYRRLTNTVA